MSFYDLSKSERELVYSQIYSELSEDIKKLGISSFLKYFSDSDTYIRKCGYLATGRIYFNAPTLSIQVIKTLEDLFSNENHHVRQTAVNAAGEIAIKEFLPVQWFFDEGLKDVHHTVRNAVIGSIKKSGQKNPIPVLKWAETYLQHPDKEIRREICHGIELRGRTHPQEILPLLRVLEFDKTSRVRKTLIHVIGQIAYKKGCLEVVINNLRYWKNKDLVHEALKEILVIHDRYKDFSYYTTDQAKQYIELNYKDL